jgi:hypothetical protein
MTLALIILGAILGYLVMGCISARISNKFFAVSDREIGGYLAANLIFWPIILPIAVCGIIYDQVTARSRGQITKTIVRGRKAVYLESLEK